MYRRIVMKVKNSDRLKEILFSTRQQIVSLQDIKIDMIGKDKKMAEHIQQQINALEEVYKHQLSIITLAEDSEPKKTSWFPIKDKFTVMD